MGDELHMMRDKLPHHKIPKKSTSVINFDRLGDIISQAYDFYSVFFTLQGLARKEFAKRKGLRIPYKDKARTGELEFLIDDKDLLCGFTVYWPDGRESTFRRREAGIEMTNMTIHADGSIGFVA
jgi:hypothetical protein